MATERGMDLHRGIDRNVCRDLRTDRMAGGAVSTHAYIDNRDAAEVYNYTEARIECLQREVARLTAENDWLRKRAEDAEAQVCALLAERI